MSGTHPSGSQPTVGITFRPQSPPEDLQPIVRAADTAGVAELWLWEDCFLEGGIASAAAALAWSERTRVGIGLLPVPLRNPALAAMEVATLERLAPGRLIAGFGHGVLSWMGQVGARKSSPLTLLREYLTAVRALLDGETVDVEGRYVQLDGVALDWPPVSAPEIVIGATGEKTLRLAGELGDGVVLSASDGRDEAAIVRAAKEIVDAGRAHSGRPGGTRIIVYTELDPGLDALEARIADRVGALGEAGADSVVLHGTAAAPDPRPYLDVLPA
ncbi:LLM class flavin-dependent oxidoreductase [Microbacterium bovistercoris]|uniref:LLM class flavin-dependent oxidoreductase n=1 Tax=Microbacterium bovistercoris TaxID=2293570 RepID=A0A371NP23_9MICO|nr:LLM class flavin-dependent oxidoreductase [Microbacterium bovistercoris]REJ03910.1 LLM class flavin-dependent oxidoreductase [Microbacterium bovistercoris]